MMLKRSRPGVQVLHKSVDVLEALQGAPAGLGLAELAASVGMPKATVHRILATFESRGYLDRLPGGGYRLGRKIFDLMQNGETSQQRLIEAARPPMECLLATCRETLNLGVLDACEVVIIETMESPQSVRMSSKVGNRRFAHSTALGKTLLAALEEKEVARIIRMKGLPRFTEATLVTEPALGRELARVRQAGFAVDNRENELDGRCVSAPIRAASGQVIAALGISGPLPRMTVARLRSFSPGLIEACQKISKTLGA